MEYVWIVLKICLIVAACFQIIRWVVCCIGNKYKTENYMYLSKLLQQPRDDGWEFNHGWSRVTYFNQTIVLRFAVGLNAYGYPICRMYINDEEINFDEFYWWEKQNIKSYLMTINSEGLKANVKRMNSNTLAHVKTLLN